ncbi:tyrosine-type recombinase/integrase [Lactococcus lactis]|uniref:tyrosine-type recombinase/integrase n=1 Tax=Lactococcus lactis TaxID=1358 RepID=UPI00114340C2|nr:site-specific integrase [Lactococcus lactis]UPG97476.1 site-specific integrase [Lactococcus lactis]GEB09103.1 site-specific integrase [Lactococcus lactis subsp. lactis]
MDNIKISNITIKSIKDSPKKGSKEVKFRSSFKNPLTNKRREFLSEWYTVNENYDDKGNLKISSQFQSIIKRDMQNWANKLYQDISKVQLISEDNLTIQKVWNEWHDDRVAKKKVAPKTLAGEVGRFNNHITRFIPRDSLLKNIRSELIQSLLDDLYPVGNHKRIAQSIKSDLSSLYTFAVKKNYILPEQNPMSYVTVEEKGLSEQLEQLENSNIENHYLEKDELNEVLTIVRKYNQQYARILEFQVLTGMRIGEVLGLKISAISFDTGLATIRRTRATHGGASKDNYEGDVKNKQSYRTIKLSSKALLLLQEELEINQHHIIGNPDYKDKGWIFTSKSSNKSDYNGTPLHYSVINNFLNSSETGKITKTGHLKKVGINIDNRLSFNKHISTHIFRHTFVSHMAEKGVPLLAVQRYIGHKSGSKITEEIYTHITKKMSDNITESIDTLID